MRTLDHTRVTIAAQAVGIAQGALDYAPATSRSASSSASRSPTSRDVQFMLADMAMKLEAARQLTYTAAAKPMRRRCRT
jgi:alkylation response protein AidB-like acyl-CoA dehydrogenase